MTKEAKIGWIAVIVLLVLVLGGFAWYGHGTHQAPASSETATSTTETASSTFPAFSASTTPQKPLSTSIPPKTSADGTVLFKGANTLTVGVGKSAVETVTGFRLTLKSIDGKVAMVQVNTGSCNDGKCISQENTAENVQFSAGMSLGIDGYMVAVMAVSPSAATFTVTPL